MMIEIICLVYTILKNYITKGNNSCTFTAKNVLYRLVNCIQITPKKKPYDFFVRSYFIA